VRSRIVWTVALVFCLSLLLLAATAGWVASRPSVVTVDGISRVVDNGVTVGSLGPGALKAAAGDLLAIDGTVARAQGGEPPRVLRNGRPAAPGERLHNGDVIVSRQGADMREALETTQVPIPYIVTYQGKGSLLQERVPGVPGLRVVTRGAQSRMELSSTVLKEPRAAVVQRIHPRAGSKIVALTFDDGPWPKNTRAILDVLKREQVPATFFMLGIRVKRDPGVARRAVAEGHQVANHSLSHRYLPKQKTKEIKRQITGGRRTIKKYAGVDTNWLRPPYGAMSAKTWRVVRTDKSRVVMWDVDSKDWKKPGAMKIARNVVRHTKRGSIVLMHDGGGDRRQTVKALPIIIKKLKAKGYTFVTVEELYTVERAARK
jgi:peptidoglycan/xylan/chitin deacetylase (PgdA/CDA1 family)